ncbi:MAG TPA: phage terminase large subunit [Gammaproteobacteria bacterium]|nr:phage terminase large subunit [Gammaproteobacteria bacterium]
MNAQLQQLDPLDMCVGDLLCYARAQWPRLKISVHHRLIADALMDLEQRRVNRLSRWPSLGLKYGQKLNRLIIETPPRHSKTLLVSGNFPAWYLGRNPDDYVISTTYNQDRANDLGRFVRDLMNDATHTNIFAQQLKKDSKAAHRFELDNGRGSYFAVGRGGPITGRGAHIMLIDDPLKDRMEADSEVIRRQLRDWYSSVLYTRLMPGAAICLVMTRWHEDDLSGYVQGTSDGWVVIKLPALAEENDILGRDKGAALWPEQYNETQLADIKSTIFSRDWWAMFQQRPQPEEGHYFKRDWFGVYDDLPADLHYYLLSDHAVTEDEGDFTEHGLVGIDHRGVIYLVDWYREQATADVWLEAGLDMVDQYQPLMWIGEGGPIRRAVEPFIAKRMRERKSFCRTEWLPSIHDKPTRARSIQARAAQGMVKIPRKADWLPDLMNQLVTFPNGKYDDGVDVLSLLGRALDDLIDASLAPKAKDTGLKPFSTAWLEHDYDGDNHVPKRLY